MINTLEGKVDWFRMGGQEVQAGSRYSYAIKHERNMTAALASNNQMLFSGVGVGLKPVCISASSADLIRKSLKRSDVTFALDGELIESKVKGLFKIYAALRELKEVKPVEIFDATAPAIMNVATCIPSFLGFGSTHTLRVNGSLTAGAQDAAGTMLTLKGNVSSKSIIASIFLDNAKNSRKIGLIVHFYEMKGSKCVSSDRISSNELAKHFFEDIPGR